MSPQRRGVVPPGHLERIQAAQKAAADAEQALHQAVADALNAGASINELAKATGLAKNTVQAWGRANGWPSDLQQRVRAEKKAARDEFNARMKAADALIKHVDLGSDS